MGRDTGRKGVAAESSGYGGYPGKVAGDLVVWPGWPAQDTSPADGAVCPRSPLSPSMYRPLPKFAVTVFPPKSVRRGIHVCRDG